MDREVKKKKEVHEYRLPHRIVSSRLKLRFILNPSESLTMSDEGRSAASTSFFSFKV